MDKIILILFLMFSVACAKYESIGLATPETLMSKTQKNYNQLSTLYGVERTKVLSCEALTCKIKNSSGERTIDLTNSNPHIYANDTFVSLKLEYLYCVTFEHLWKGKQYNWAVTCQNALGAKNVEINKEAYKEYSIETSLNNLQLKIHEGNLPNQIPFYSYGNCIFDLYNTLVACNSWKWANFREEGQKYSDAFVLNFFETYFPVEFEEIRHIVSK